ncbi:MAG: hypothetical protein QM820_10855 [Minicystis sp.]
MRADAFQLFAVSAVTMALSHTIARERIFAPLRERLGGMNTWAGYLVSCPYCVSHWIAFIVVPLTGAYAVEVAPDWGAASAVIRWFLSSIFVTAIAAFLRVIFDFVDYGQGLVRREQRKVEAETERAEER